jgi:hypothetical protein
VAYRFFGTERKTRVAHFAIRRSQPHVVDQKPLYEKNNECRNNGPDQSFFLSIVPSCKRSFVWGWRYPLPVAAA